MADAAPTPPPASAITFARMTADDFLAIDRQPSQRVCLQGKAPTLEEAEQLAAEDESWTARDSEGRLLACMGIAETFAGQCGVVWAVLANLIGHHHLAITRFAKSRIAASTLPRLEALARCRDVNPIGAFRQPRPLERQLEYAMRQPTPECRWPQLLGLEPVHLLRKFGATGDSYVLFERILP